eukprot:TRINITY_DN3071_c0_g1_i2.p1 TRINITY_DN3071_c0_g1~~TRINITY_DN3071_c0_g1_i2.p1  ORF type:complete len:251 (+),score=23.65 TRINITY_DN3071_c0_g1_i2:60-812(+)
MASTQEQPVVSSRSLHTVICEKASSAPPRVSRCILCAAKVPPKKEGDIPEPVRTLIDPLLQVNAYSSIIATLPDLPQGAPLLTGLLFDTPQNILWVVEADSPILIHCLRLFLASPDIGRRLEHPCLVNWTDETTRWLGRHTSFEHAVHGEDVSSTDRLAMVALAARTAVHLRDVCTQVARRETLQAATFLSQLRTSEPHLLPGVAAVSALIQSQDVGMACPLAPFVKFVSQPVEAVLAADLGAPAPTPQY